MAGAAHRGCRALSTSVRASPFGRLRSGPRPPASGSVAPRRRCTTWPPSCAPGAARSSCHPSPGQGCAAPRRGRKAWESCSPWTPSRRRRCSRTWSEGHGPPGSSPALRPRPTSTSEQEACRTFRCQCCGLAGPADLIAAANVAFLGSCDLGRGEVTRPDAGAQACRSAHGTCRSIATVTPHIPRDTPGSCPRGPHAVLPASSAVSRAPIGTSGGPPSRPLDQLGGDHQRTDEGKRAEAMGDRAVGVPSHPLCQTASTTDGSMHSTTVSSRSRILPRLSRGIKPQAQDAAVQNVFPQASGAV